MIDLKNKIALTVGKLSLQFLKIFNKSGTALPGKLALTVNKSFLDNINSSCDKIILITGTNGKTTTNNLINYILDEYTLLSNLKGANMIQGVATTYVRDTKDYYDYGIFEVDEGSLDHVSRYLKPDYIILTNFFRDQLDRYGEIEGIIDEVLEDIKLLPDTTLILNCDDPFVNQFKYKLPNPVLTFGMNIESKAVLEKNLMIDKCPLCGKHLSYSRHFFAHLGDYECDYCGFNNKNKDCTVEYIDNNESSQEITLSYKDNTFSLTYPYTGLYNTYNACASFLITKELGLDPENILARMENFNFSLGRMEEFSYKNRIIRVILTKNPVGLGQVTGIISEDKRRKSILHILNDNPADGIDISWIWDANTKCSDEESIKNYYCSGIRAEEIALKKKYDDVPIDKIHVNDDMYESINTAIEDDVEIIYILPTYTAIFETRDYISKIVEKEQL